MEEKMTNLLNPNDPPNGPKSTIHSHDLRLKTDVVHLVGDAFKFAPVPNPDGNPPGISLHMDLGDFNATDDYIIKGTSASDGTIRPEGGDSVDERWPFFYCTSGASCVFPNQPGIIHWALGVPILQGSLVTPTAACKADPTNCPRYFNNYRELVFRYLFVGHDFAAKGSALPQGGFSTRKVSGHAHHPGNTAAVTLGGWTFTKPGDIQVGDKITLAAVILHELAHLIGGNHGGTVTGPNCNPNDQSVLNYLYVRGLPKADGTLAIDLSRQVLNPVNPTDEDENSLKEFQGLGLGIMPYRLISYVPVANVAARLGLKQANLITGAKRYCGGSALVNTGVVRAVFPSVARSPIDWNYNGKIDTPP